MSERIKKTKLSHPNLDMTKPVPVREINEAAAEQDCFTFLWQPQHPMCAICADSLLCGIQYNARQSKKVKIIEKEKGGYLDSNLFDCIEQSDLLAWCEKQQRTTQELIDKVTKVSKCPDEQTVINYCVSFIKSTKCKTKGGIIYTP